MKFHLKLSSIFGIAGIFAFWFVWPNERWVFFFIGSYMTTQVADFFRIVKKKGKKNPT